MRVLILSDIHANIDALDAVLEAAPQHDVVWNLGDIVGYCAAPTAVINRVREIGNVFVRGNHDRACAGLTQAEAFNPIAFRAVQWTQGQLSPESIQWLKELPRGPIQIDAGVSAHDGHDSDSADSFQNDTRGITCVHGSLLDEDAYLLSSADAERQLKHARTQITFFGHTHIQGGFGVNAAGECFPLKPVYTGDDTAESYDLNLRSGAKYLINPGSVGQPRDHDWRVAFALYDDTTARVTFFRVPYDVRLAQMRIQRAGLPDMLASRLRAGR